MIPETLKNVKILGEFIIHKQHQAIVSWEFDYLEYFKWSDFWSDKYQDENHRCQARSQLCPSQESQREERRHQRTARLNSQHWLGKVVLDIMDTYLNRIEIRVRNLTKCDKISFWNFPFNKNIQDFWSLTKEQVADLKEVFMLFDKVQSKY